MTVDTTADTPNSVAVHPHHDYFLVVLGGRFSGVRWRLTVFRTVFFSIPLLFLAVANEVSGTVSIIEVVF